MQPTHVEIDGIRVPRFLYGTAWKEAETERLTSLALKHGFRGIDTANQRRHYVETAVGTAIAKALDDGLLTRAELFLQTKFTFVGGQDDRLPYDAKAPVAKQVEQSFATSLTHLNTDYVDSYVLHGPSRRVGLAPTDWEAWRAMEAICESGRARLLGVSNVSLEQLQALCANARVRPRFVQNRCYAARGWDRPIRDFCASNGVTYQGFSLLTANRDVLVHPRIAAISAARGHTPAQIVFRFALEVGMMPLTGTTDPAHMQEDLGVFQFQLGPDLVRLIETLA